MAATASFRNLQSLFLLLILLGCTKKETTSDTYPAISREFGGKISLSNLDPYYSQSVPGYINKDNARGTIINDAKATLGRVLFYDKNLSVNNTISCNSCHRQQFAFSDTNTFSNGVLGGSTGRHSMRLVNARFANEARFFWDERANNLPQQTTQPIKDHAEMGFSGQNGRPDFTALLTKLEAIDYYRELFQFVYNDTRVTENRLQESLTHFILSIQSFDSKFDAGLAQANNLNSPFPNFTQQENEGKQLFLAPPVFNPAGVRTGGGAGCQPCHGAPEFDIDPNSRNNGVIAAKGGGTDLNNTRAPSLRDLVNTNGIPNSPFMHNGIFRDLLSVINHYNEIPAVANNNLDPKLRPNGNPQRLMLTNTEKNALVAFLKTLSGTAIYTKGMYSDPF